MRALIQSLPSAIVLVDGDRIVEWNTAATTLYGWSAHETIGQPFETVLIDEADGNELRAVFEQVGSRGKWQGNFRVRRKDGALLVSSFLATMVRDEGEVRLAWVATDTVDQHLAEQERQVIVSAQHAATMQLETTVGLFEALLESAPMGIAMLDLGLRCTHANNTFVEMIGADVSPAGEYLDDLAVLPAEVLADLRRVATTGRTITDRQLTLPTVPGSGRRHVRASYFPIYAEDRLAGAGLTWTDVTAVEAARGEQLLLAERATAAQHRLSLLASTSALLISTTQVQLLIDRLARLVAPSASDWCLITITGKTGIIEHVAVSGADRELAKELATSLAGNSVEPTPGSISARVRATGQAHLLGGAELKAYVEAAARVPGYAGMGRLGLTSAVVVPIKTRSEPIGLLTMANAESAPLGDDDVDTAVEIGHRAALALDRAIRYQNEHALAERLQQALLPGRLPELAGCRIETLYSAAADAAMVGGDWYDVLQVSPTAVLVCVGDVIGHDINAAVGMGQLRNLMRAFVAEAVAGGELPDLTLLLQRIDRLIYDDPTAWATCVVALLDTSKQTIRWVNAGHPPMMLLRDGVVRELDGSIGAMLGVTRAAERTVGEEQLFGGDRLLLYTDGLVERRGEPLDRSLVRLSDALWAHRDRPLDRICTAITDTVLAGMEQADDIAILVAEIVDV